MRYMIILIKTQNYHVKLDKIHDNFELYTQKNSKKLKLLEFETRNSELKTQKV